MGQLVPVAVLCVVVLCWLALSQATLTFTAFTPGTVRIPASTKNVTRLPSSVRCSESDAGRMCTCTVNSNRDPFETWWLSDSAGYFVYYDNSARLVSGSTYVLQVECKSNNEGPTFTQMLTVEVTKNQPPLIADYNQDAVTVDGKATRQYDPIYSVRYTDPEKDTVTFTMTQNPDLGHFIIGVDRNSVPQFTNLPATVTIPETAKRGDTVIDLILYDPDQFVPQNPVCIPTSASDQRKFIFDMSKNQIKVAYDGALESNTSSTITINCSWSDGYLTSDPSEVLTINVADVNKPPAWSTDNYFCSIDEGKTGGSSCSLGATVTDPEGDFFTVEVVTSNNERFFTYSPGSDLMRYIVNYDLDTGGYAQDVTAIMTAADSKGASSTATVMIHVNDVNDNTCQTDPEHQFQLDETDELRQLGVVSGTDDDLTSPNKDLHYQVDSADPASATDHVLVARSGEVFYTRLFPASTTYATLQILVLCVDAGTPRLTSTSTVVVTYGIPPTTFTSTATTTTTEKSIWKYDSFKAIFATLMALLGIGGVLLLGSLLACCCSGAGCRNCYSKPPSKALMTKASPYQQSAKPRSLPPIEYTPPVTRTWENLAWSQNEDMGPTDSTRYHHYH